MKEGDEQSNNSLLEKRYLAAVFSSPEEVKQWNNETMNNEQWNNACSLLILYFVLCITLITWLKISWRRTGNVGRFATVEKHLWLHHMPRSHYQFILDLSEEFGWYHFMIALQWYWCQTMSFTTCGYSVKIILHLALSLLQTHFYCHAMRSDYKCRGHSRNRPKGGHNSPQCYTLTRFAEHFSQFLLMKSSENFTCCVS